MNGKITFHEEDLGEAFVPIRDGILGFDLPVDSFSEKTVFNRSIAIGPKKGQLMIEFRSKDKMARATSLYCGTTVETFCFALMVLYKNLKAPILCGRIPAGIAMIYYPLHAEFQMHADASAKIVGVKTQDMSYFRHLFTPLRFGDERLMVSRARKPVEVIKKDFKELYLPTLAVALACINEQDISKVFEKAWDYVDALVNKTGDLYDLVRHDELYLLTLEI